MSVLCIGQLVADVVVRPVDPPPTVGTTALVDELELIAGGCAANTACVLAKLGLDTRLLGLVGRDAVADTILDQIAACGVHIEGVMRDSGLSTSAVIVMVDRNGEKSCLYRRGGSESLTAEMIPDSALRNAEYVHVGGAMKLDGLDLAALMARARRIGCTTSLDTDWDPTGRWLEILEPALSDITYLLTNTDEGRALTGASDAVEIARRLIAKGAHTVIVKRGHLGAAVVTALSVRESAAYCVPVLDTACAGDGFAAGFLFGLAQGWSTDSSVDLANAVGALCTTETSHLGVKSVDSALELIRARCGETEMYQMRPQGQGRPVLALEETR